MAVTSIQTAFSAGEISPELYGEVNLAKFNSSATTLRNMIVAYKGGLMSRGGFAFVGRCKEPLTGTGPPRPIPFIFNITQAYVLEFGDNYIRFVFQGGYVLENPIPITGASQANPCVISVTGTPFNNGDWVFVAGVVGMTQLNRNTYIVSGVSSGSLSLYDLNGNPVDSTAFNAYISGGTLSRIYTITSPYAAIDLPYLKYAQSADVMSLTCSNPVTGTEYPPYDLTRLAAADWTLTLTDFDAAIAPPTTVSAACQSQAPSNGVNATFAYQVTAVDGKGNESVASATASCHGADLEVEAGTNTITWSFVTGAKFYNVYRAPPSVDTGTGSSATPNPVPAGSIFGFVGSSYGTQFLDTRSVVDLTQTPPTHQNPFAPGQILAVNITGGGSGQTVVTYAITTIAGTNFVGYPIVIGGSLGGFLITNNGELYRPGDTIAFNGAGFASGSIQFGSTNPSANDTVTLNGVVWTFVNSITGPQQTVIAGALSGTLASLASNLSASSDPALILASYTVDITNSNLLINYKTAGSAGNSYTLAASRATPSGATLAGGSGSGAAGAAATGNLLFSVNPTNTQTIILDGVTWTFVTAGATGNQTNIGGNLAATLTQLQLDLTASLNANIALSNYAVTTTRLNITYKVVGTIGNSYTLAGGTSGATPSAATLTGGTNASSTPTGTLDIGPTSGTFPGVNAYFQQRHFFANSLNDPDTFWASQTGLYRNFDTSIPTKATDAITASPWSEQVNGIEWLIPMPGGLIAFTGSRAWQIIGEGSYNLNAQPITPSSTQAQPQAFNGCSATVPPIVVDYDVLYVEAISSVVRDLAWNFWTNIYTGTDLTILSSHLFFYRQIVQWTWARNPYKVLWACCDDGTLLSMTYLKEQEVYGWARHDTQGLVVGIASVSEPPVNAVYVIVKRFLMPGSRSSSSTYIMETEENYDPTWVNGIDVLGTLPNNFGLQNKISTGGRFDAVGRKFIYTMGIRNTNTQVNTTGFVLWDGGGTAVFGVIAIGGNYDARTQFNHWIAEKNIDTNAVTFHQCYDSTKLVPTGIGPTAIGNYEFTANPSNGDTIILNGVTWTFVTSGATGNQTNIKATALASFKQLSWDLNNSANGSLTGAYYTAYDGSPAGTTVLGITYRTGGTAGNAYTLGAASGGTPSGATLAGGATPSDGTWRRFVEDDSDCSNDDPLMVDPRTGDAWHHGGVGCIIYLFRRSDNFAQVISPFHGPRGQGAHLELVGISDNWTYVRLEQVSKTYFYTLALIPRTITSPEITLDVLVSYAEFVQDPLWNGYYFRSVLNHATSMFIYGGSQTGTRAFKLHRFDEPSAAPFGGPTVGGGFTDITPWGPATGPNSNVAAYTVDGIFATPSTYGVNKYSLYYLPVTNELVCINKLWAGDTSTGWSNPNLTRFDCTYVQLTGNTFDYHQGFVTGYMTASWAPTSNPALAAWVVLNVRELDLYLGQNTFAFSGVDYTKRWFYFEVQPVVAGSWSYDVTKSHTIMVQYKFASGSAPTVVQIYDENGWDTAYSAYGASIGNTNVVYNSLGSFQISDAIGDAGIYDSQQNAFYWAGNDAGANLCFLTPAYLAFRQGFINSNKISGPFLKLSFGAPSVVSGSGYYMERMDNRLWQTVEDAYAVDCAVSNPMSFPSTTLLASAASGTGVTFTAGASAFSSLSVNRIIRMSGGIARVTAYTSPFQVTGTWLLGASNGVVGTPFAAAGNWSIAEQVTTLNAPHLAGTTVVGLGDGVPFSGLAVGTNGIATLPFPASNVKIGLSFTAQMQTPYLNGQQVTQGARKVIPACTVRVAASGPFEFGTNQPDGGAQNPQQLAPNWAPMTPSIYAQMTGGQAPPITYTSPGGQTVTQVWTGDFRVIGDGADWNSKGQVAVQQRLPLALEVTMVSPEVLPGDAQEVTYQPKPQSAGQEHQQQRGPGRWMIGGGGGRL
jgi:hypothetical protein